MVTAGRIGEHWFKRLVPDATEQECQEADKARAVEEEAHHLWDETFGKEPFRKGWPRWYTPSDQSIREIRKVGFERWAKERGI